MPHSFFHSCPKPRSSVPALFSLFRPLSRPAPPRGILVQPIDHRARSMSSNRAFQLRVDPLTGDSEWVVLVGEEEQEAATDTDPKALLAATSYFDMLNDRRRNRCYRLAIEKALPAPCHVLDIGAGTGLLSMMAARAMGGRGRVSACEAYLPMGKLMRRVLRDNGLEKAVRLFHKRSDELAVGRDLDSRADVLVSEILDSELLGEGLIPTLQHAHDSLLVENPRTVPFRATTYGQLVESKFLWSLCDLYSSEVFASDGIHLAPAGLERIVRVKQQQYAMHCSAISEEIQLLSEPFKIFEFDFWKRPDSHGETQLHIRAIYDGNVHAVVSWWVLQLDYEGSIFYSTAPKWLTSVKTQDVPQNIGSVKDWCDHWKQCVWFWGAGTPVSKNEQVLVHAVHDETSISYFLNFDQHRVNNSLKAEDSDLLLLPERIAVYGDKSWRSAMSTAIKNALQARPSPLCVVADDSVFLTILAASLSENSNVISFFPGLKERGTLYLQAVAEANGFSMDRVKVIGKRTSCLAKDAIAQKVDLLLGEPFYYGNEGALPWQNLRFWKERTLLDSLLSEDVVIMPCRGILKACAMFLPDLWQSRCRLQNVECFDHSFVNETLGACGDLPPPLEGPCLPYFIWQCGEAEKLSEVFSVMDFNFRDLICPCSGKRKISFSQPGLCHGFALWIDWVMDDNNSIVISTGPDSRYWKQGVKLLSKPVVVDVDEYCSAEIEASFEPSTGEITIKSSFSAT